MLTFLFDFFGFRVVCLFWTFNFKIFIIFIIIFDFFFNCYRILLLIDFTSNFKTLWKNSF